MARLGVGSTIRRVFFDLGGTLVDNSDPTAWSEAAARHGVEVDEAHLVHALAEVETENDADPHPWTFSEYWRHVLERAAGRPVDLSTADRFVADFPPDRPAHVRLYSDVRNCLGKLERAGHRLGVISNSQSQARVERILESVGIRPHFDVVVSSGTEGVRKPDPEIFRRALARAGARPEESVYVGDLPNTDARAATSAGLHGFWLHRDGLGLGDDPPEITSLTELPFRVARLSANGPR